MLTSRFIFIFLLWFVPTSMWGQEVFIIEGDTLELKQEVKGELNLFWTVRDGEYRYFVQKGNKMLELKNTIVQGRPQQEYKNQLKELTPDAKIATGDVIFKLYDLKYFVNRYNAAVQEDYIYNSSTPNIKTRIGLFIGLSNNRYTYNPQNILAPVLGVEFEIYDPNLAPKHSAFLQLRQSFPQNEFQYSATQLSLNYRFRILNFNKFNLHINTKLATFLYAEDRKNNIGADGMVIGFEDENGFSFTTPLSFGIGSDIKITNESFITIGYNDIVSIFLDSNGNFPVDFTIGYKYNL